MQTSVAYNVPLSKMSSNDNVYVETYPSKKLAEKNDEQEEKVEQNTKQCTKKVGLKRFQAHIIFIVLMFAIIFTTSMAIIFAVSTDKPAKISPTPTESASTIYLVTSETPTSPVSEQCGGPGWRRVAFINMTDPNQDCPQRLNLTSFSSRSCGRSNLAKGKVCDSVFFPVNGTPYSKVCGKVLGYRYSLTIGFYGYHSGRGLNEQYVDGISLTHGVENRTHIWTFVSGMYQGTDKDKYARNRCPCDPNNPFSSPPFVGSDYTCESVLLSNDWRIGMNYVSDNALWDGEGCAPGNPCCEFNNAPWFTRVLPNPTREDIEFRLCFNHAYANIAVEQFELYIN